AARQPDRCEELTGSADRVEIRYPEPDDTPRAPTVADETPDLAEVRLDKLRQLEALGIDPWGHRFDNTTPIDTIRQLPCEPFDGPTPGPQVRAAGRVIGRRVQGKVYFLDLWDQTGKVQVMAGRKQVGEDGWRILELLDLGDLIGVDGEYGRTRMGEQT